MTGQLTIGVRADTSEFDSLLQSEVALQVCNRLIDIGHGLSELYCVNGELETTGLTPQLRIHLQPSDLFLDHSRTLGGGIGARNVENGVV